MKTKSELYSDWLEKAMAFEASHDAYLVDECVSAENCLPMRDDGSESFYSELLYVSKADFAMRCDELGLSSYEEATK